MLTDLSPASSLVVPQTVEQTNEMSYSNGNLSPQASQPLQNEHLSPHHSALSPSSPTSAEPHQSDPPVHTNNNEDTIMKDEESELSDGLSDADASGDDDFEIEFEEPPPPTNGRSSSPEERRPPKRKAGGAVPEEEAYIANLKEFGARRSVCELFHNNEHPLTMRRAASATLLVLFVLAATTLGLESLT